MHEDTLGALAFDARARADSVHELCNAVTILAVGTWLPQRMLQQGRVEDARGVLEGGTGAWERRRDLCLQAGEATALITMPAGAGQDAASPRR